MKLIKINENKYQLYGSDDLWIGTFTIHNKIINFDCLTMTYDYEDICDIKKTYEELRGQK